MATQITRWTPDTCAEPRCVVEYSWDDQANVRVHALMTVIQQCPLHESLSLDNLWAALIDENTRKNKLIDLIKTEFSLTDEQMNRVTWAYDESHVLQVSLPSWLTLAEKAKISDLAENNFGTGKVTIE